MEAAGRAPGFPFCIPHSTFCIPMTLSPKVFVITGAFSGIGLATVRECLGAGAAGVVAVDVAEETPDALARLHPSRLALLPGCAVRLESPAGRFTPAALGRLHR